MKRGPKYETQNITTVWIPSQLRREAKKLHINMSKVCRDAIRAEIRKIRRTARSEISE